ncbi:MAG TPA: hypothetical protein VHX12_06880 [Acidisoma sp.]|nr:hypothetical protein [Acidisoma sp.]
MSNMSMNSEKNAPRIAVRRFSSRDMVLWTFPVAGKAMAMIMLLPLSGCGRDIGSRLCVVRKAAARIAFGHSIRVTAIAVTVTLATVHAGTYHAVAQTHSALRQARKAVRHDGQKQGQCRPSSPFFLDVLLGGSLRAAGSG